MNCAWPFCTQLAEFTCCNKQSYWCIEHIGKHLTVPGPHNGENLYFATLESARLDQIRSDLTKRIKKIQEAKTQILSSGKSLTRAIESHLEQAINSLNSITESYIKLLKRAAFYEQEMPEIEKIQSEKIILKTSNTEEIKSKIEEFFAQDLLSYKENYKFKRFQFLNQHAAGFQCGVVTEDGQTLVTGGYDSTIRAWDLDQKKQKFMLLGHNSKINSIALTGDSKNIISGSFDATVRIWSILEMRQVAILKEHKDPVYAVCFIKENSLIASGDFGGELIIWRFSDHSILKKLKFSIIICLNPIKSLLSLILGSNPDIVFYELETGNKIKTFKGHSNAVWCTALTRDEKVMASGSDDNLIIIWNIESSIILSKLSGHNGGINSLVFTSDDNFIVSGSDDETVRLWNRETGSQINKFDGHTHFVHSILKAKNNFLSLSRDSGIGNLDIVSKKFEVNWFMRPFESEFVNFIDDSRLIGYGSKNEGCIWDLKKGTDQNILIGHVKQVFYVEVSRDGRCAITCSRDSQKNLVLWDLASNRKISDLVGHSDTVFCAAFSKDALSAASGSGDKTVRTWDLKNFKEVFKFERHTGFIYSIKFIDEKKLLVSAGADEKVMIWNLRDGSEYAVLNGHSHYIYKTIVTEDENFIVSGDLYEGIRVWSVDEKKLIFHFEYENQAANWLKKNKIPKYQVRRFLKAS